MNNPSPKPKTRVIKIAPTGRLTFIYDDALSGLLQAGTCRVDRASHVEPKLTPEGVRWFADLAPVAGPKLGPFPTRAAALENEVEWLTANRIYTPREEATHALP